jgi:hypothetical protein
MTGNQLPWTSQVVLSSECPLRCCCIVDIHHRCDDSDTATDDPEDDVDCHDSLVVKSSNNTRRGTAVTSAHCPMVVIGSNSRTLHTLQLALPPATAATVAEVLHALDFPDVHRGSLYACAYKWGSGDGVLLVATGSNDKSVQLLHFQMTPTRGYVTHSRPVAAVAVRQDAYCLPQLLKTQLLKGHTGTIRSVKYYIRS